MFDYFTVYYIKLIYRLSNWLVHTVYYTIVKGGENYFPIDTELLSTGFDELIAGKFFTRERCKSSNDLLILPTGPCEPFKLI